jgi:DNA-binding SARP family transcriptional activator/tetratricopeptide (TPR) repeat protein
MIELRVLGSIDLFDQRGRSVRSILSQPKRLALLTYLAVQPSRFHSRDTLIGLFWPDVDERHARAALRQTLYYLRRSLGPGVINGWPTTVEVQSDRLWSDARDFLASIDAGMYERALSLYRGDLLPGFYLARTREFEGWLDRERARLRELAAQAAWTLSDQDARAGRGLASTNWGRRGLSIMPEDETSARRLMVQLDALGDRAGAIRVYEDLSRHLAADLQLEPAPETQAVADAIRRRTVAHASAGERSARSLGQGRGPTDLSLAVLRFDGSADGAGGNGLASGLTDRITAELAQVQGLRVVCRSSSDAAMTPGQETGAAGRALNVRYLLQGSVRRVEHELCVTAHLVDTHERRVLWTEERSGTIDDLTDIRQSLVYRTSATLGLSATRVVSPSPRPGSEEVSLLQADGHARREMARWTPQGFDHAICLTGDALSANGDDEFVLATLGEAHLPRVLLGTRPNEEHLARAEHCAARILALNPASVAGLVLRGFVRLRQGKAGACAADLRAALRADPNNRDALFWLTLVYVISGRGPEARPVAEHLLAVDPLNSTFRCLPGYIEAHRGHFEVARPHYETMYRMEPKNPANWWCYSQLLLRAGRTQDATALVNDVIAEAPATPIARQARVLQAALAGNRAHARLALTEQVRREAQWDEHGSWWLSCALTMAGEKDEAIRWLGNAVRLGFVDESFLGHIDPCLEGLRGHQGFRQVMDRAKQAYEQFDAAIP